MTKREKRAQAVLDALEGGKALTIDGLVTATGLTHTAVSRAVTDIRNRTDSFITVPTQKDGYRYRIAETVDQTVPGALNQQKHALTRALSAETLAAHQRRMAVSAQDVAVAEVIEKSATATRAMAELTIASLSVVALSVAEIE
jgi:hypothetical protein